MAISPDTVVTFVEIDVTEEPVASLALSTVPSEPLKETPPPKTEAPPLTPLIVISKVPTSGLATAHNSTLLLPIF